MLAVVTTAQRLDLDVQGDWMSGRRGTRRKEYGLRASQLTATADEKVLAEHAPSGCCSILVTSALTCAGGQLGTSGVG